MNKKGQLAVYTLMLAVVVFVLAVALSSPVKQFTDNARAPSNETQVGLDCNNSTISDFQKAQCVITDISLPYFVIGMLAIAGMIVGAKVFFGGGQ